METKMTQDEMLAAVEHLQAAADELRDRAEDMLDYACALREALLVEVGQ